MALASIGEMMWPPPLFGPGTPAITGSAQNVTFDATNDQVAGTYVAQFSDTITKIHIRLGTITTAATMRCGVYALGTDGRPALTPTYWSANGTGATPSADLLISGSGTYQTFTLTNGAVMVPGDAFAIVLSYVSGSTPSFICPQCPVGVNGMMGQSQMTLLSNAGGAYAQSGFTTPWEWIIECNGVFPFVKGMLPLSGAATLTAFQTGSTPDERGMKITIPFKGRAIGARVPLANLGANSAFTVSLWDSTVDGADGQTALAASPSYDGDSVYSATNDGYIDVAFTSPYTVTAGTTYHVGVRNTTAVNISAIDFPTGIANSIGAFGAGTNLCHLATRTWSGTNPGAWSYTTTTYNNISLIFDQLDDAAQTAAANVLRGSVIH